MRCCSEPPDAVRPAVQRQSLDSAGRRWRPSKTEHARARRRSHERSHLPARRRTRPAPRSRRAQGCGRATPHGPRRSSRSYSSSQPSTAVNGRSSAPAGDPLEHEDRQPLSQRDIPARDDGSATESRRAPRRLTGPTSRPVTSAWAFSAYHRSRCPGDRLISLQPPDPFAPDNRVVNSRHVPGRRRSAHRTRRANDRRALRLGAG